MASLFETAFEARPRTAADRAFGVTVSYRRGELSIDVLSYREDVEAVNDPDSMVNEHIMAFIVKETAFAELQTSDTQPQRGDSVVTASGDTYDIFPAFGDSVWEWTNAQHTHYKIYAIQRSVS